MGWKSYELLQQIGDLSDDLLTGSEEYHPTDKSAIVKRLKSAGPEISRKKWEKAKKKSARGWVYQGLYNGLARMEKKGTVVLPGSAGSYGLFENFPAISGAAVLSGDTAVLLDVTEPYAFRDLIESAKNTVCIISHSHVDHLPSQTIRSIADLVEGEMIILGSEKVKEWLETDRFTLRKTPSRSVKREECTDYFQSKAISLKHTDPEGSANSYVFSVNGKKFVFLSDGGWTDESLKEYREAVEGVRQEKIQVIVTARGVARTKKTGSGEPVEELHGNLEKIKEAVLPLLERTDSVEVYVMHTGFEELHRDTGVKGAYESLKEEAGLKGIRISGDRPEFVYHSLTSMQLLQSLKT